MKYVNKFLAFSAMLCLLCSVNCGGDEPEPEPDPDPAEETPGAALVGTWAADGEEAIAYDGENPDVVSQYADFTITIDTTDAGITYSTTGSDNPTVYPSEGSFDGITEDTDFAAGASVTRQPDAIPTTMTLSNNGETLTLEFNIAEENDNARVSSISGQYTFTLTKQEE